MYGSQTECFKKFYFVLFSIWEANSVDIFLCSTLGWGHASLPIAMMPAYHKLSEHRVLEVGSEIPDANVPPTTNAKLILF